MEISVVMPVHNTGKYYKEAMDSLFQQTFRDFEVICVDDGSKDALTNQLLDEYENLDDIPVRIIHFDEPKGAAIARNTGFEYVIGKYTIFLDADDIFAPEFLERMYCKIKEDDADVCVCGFTCFYIDIDNCIQITDKYVLDRNKVAQEKEEAWLTYFPTQGWNKLCNTNFLKQNHIHFQNLTSINDVYFSCKTIKCAKKIAVIEDSSMIQYRTQTAIQITSNRNSINLYKAFECLMMEYENDEEFLKQCLVLLLLIIPGELLACKNEHSNEMLYNRVKTLVKSLEIEFYDEIVKKKCEELLENSYEKMCYKNWNSIEGHLEMFKNTLYEMFKEKQLIIWGNGNRGKAFQMFCLKNNLKVDFVVDSKNENVNRKTEYGFLIKNTDVVQKKMEMCIIATNHIIYEMLIKEGGYKDVFDLERFC